MGDWSNNLEYEQREHYGHFYDTDEDVHEEETEEETDDLISKQKVLNTLDFADNALTDEERTVEKYKELLTECINVLSSNSEYPNKCFDGMTNGEVLQALFPYVKTEDTSFNTLIGTNLDKSYVPLSREWWNSPYQKGGEE